MRALSLGGTCWLVFATAAMAAPGSTATAPNSAVRAEKPKLLILDLVSSPGAGSEVAASLTEASTQIVAAQGYFTTVSTKEVQTLLGVERQRQMLGCSGEGSSCMSELAGALGANLVLSGSLGRLGQAYQLTLQMIDSGKATTVSRSMRIANSPEALRAQLPFALAEATGTPPPPLPSHLLPYGLMGGGAAVAVLGGVLGIVAVTSENALVTELNLGSTQGARLSTVASYTDREASIRTEKVIALSAGVVGVALVGLGVWLNPSDSEAAGSSKVALVPSANGAALVGVW